jgi:hypothetical protein
MTNKPLREVLDGAIASRHRMNKHGWTKDADTDGIRAALMFAEEFQKNYPQASDERVREWCRKNWHYVEKILRNGDENNWALLLGNTNDTMNADELLRRYQAMREAQKAYFRDRTKGNLEKSKAMEQLLDRDVAAYLGAGAQKQVEQPTLDL